MTVTKTCSSGHSYTYTKPRHYGGAAFDTRRCPTCGK